MFIKWIQISLAILMLTGISYAQEVQVTSFSHNGSITWSNSVASNGFNTVEWSSSLTDGGWSSSWENLRYIPVTNENMSADVPMFYRIIWRTNIVVDANQNIGIGDGSNATFIGTLDKTIVMMGSTVVTDGNSQTLSDTKGDNKLHGDGTGDINYNTGEIKAIFNSSPVSAANITVSYSYMAGSSPVYTESLGTATGSNATFTGVLGNIPVLKNYVFILTSGMSFRDDGAGGLVGDGFGNINYDTGEISVYFTSAPASGLNVLVRYYSEQ